MRRASHSRPLKGGRAVLTLPKVDPTRIAKESALNIFYKIGEIGRFNRLQRQIASDVLQAKIEFQATDKEHDFHKSKKYIGDSNATHLQYCRRRFSLEAYLSEFTKFNQALLNIYEACARILLTLPQFHIRTLALPPFTNVPS